MTDRPASSESDPADRLADRVSERLEASADAETAAQMAAYMKTDMPFYGVKSPERKAIVRDLYKGVRPSSVAEYEAMVTSLWERPHREEKYVALNLAGKWKKWMTPASMPLYERIVREGQWWDLVDDIASTIGVVLDRWPDEIWPTIEAWIEDDDMWIRRAAMLAQRKRKERTEPDRLFRFALELAGEDEFFIRKAIGWALREYAYIDPDAVRRFLDDHAGELSALTTREASKHL